MCGKDKFHVIPHPEYPLTSINKIEARKHLRSQYKLESIDDNPILLMFGNISRYKRMDLVASLIIEYDLKCKLLIVGPIKKGNEGLYKKLRVYEESDDRILVIPHFIEEDHVSWFYSASDIAVFNYREILSSGSFHMGLAFNKTIIAPNIGCLSEETGKSNIHLFNDQNELKEMIKLHISEIGKNDKA
jgi:glycosyltransferase involved in cell wall biosynthesis